MIRTVNIAGGGLAGLSLGITLRRLDVPVTIFEASTYPRHRVCGEFISGISREELAQLGVEDVFSRAQRHRSTAWCEGGRVWARRELPSPAFGLSRNFLDDALARRFTELGGELRCNERVSQDSEGVVWATGRQRSHSEWIGLKAHYEGLALSADLEIHLEDGVYVGLTRVEEGRVNVCGLFRSQKADSSLATACHAHHLPRLAERLSAARLVPGSTKGVSNFALGWQRAPVDRVCIGDAAVMIPPFTGNGMTMALQSGMKSASALAEWSRGSADWKQTGTRIAEMHQRDFSRRIRWALILQAVLMRRPMRRLGLGLLAGGWLPFESLYHKLR